MLETQAAYLAALRRGRVRPESLRELNRQFEPACVREMWLLRLTPLPWHRQGRQESHSDRDYSFLLTLLWKFTPRPAAAVLDAPDSLHL